MSEKKRLYKLASEYNLSTESLMKFLQDKGHTVKSHMTPLTEEMMSDIYSKYKKDIEKAESHYKKVNEFHKKRTEKRAEQLGDDNFDDQEFKKEPEVVVINKADLPEEKIQEIDKNAAPKKVEPISQKVEEAPVVENKPRSESVEQVKKIDEPAVKDIENDDDSQLAFNITNSHKEKTTDNKNKSFKTQSELNIEKEKGLTILGKINLDGDKQERKDHRQNRDNRDNKDYRNNRDNKQNSDNRNNKDFRNNNQDNRQNRDRDNRFNNDKRPNRDNRPNQDNRPNRDNRPNQDNRPSQDNRPNRDNRSSQDNRPNRDNRPNQENRQNRDNRPNQENRPYRDRQNQDNRQNNQENRPYRENRPNQDNRQNRETQISRDPKLDKNFIDVNPAANISSKVVVSSDKLVVDGSQKKWKKKTKSSSIAEDSSEAAKKKKKKKSKKPEVDKQAVEDAIKQTLLGLETTVAYDRAGTRKKKRKEKHELEEIRLEQEAIEKSKLKVTEYIAVSELAKLMKVQVSEIIQKCLGLGLIVSINQRLDVETITLVADEFGFEVELQEEYSSDSLEDKEDENAIMEWRPPVVTIMGHVDHGKTSLLDYIRRANVVAGESGGITQHIGAYKVKLDNGKEIAFLDTPGHEAFTAMRARGASVTDIVVLIVAADDAVMPQTIEAINHALAANVPIIVAINKIDKPGANLDKIKQQLADRKVLVEDWGGKFQSCTISAKMGTNIDVLLEKILIEAEMLELKANFDRNARGTIIESQMDKGRGITATVLVQKGTLKVGDPFVAGNSYGRVRAMFDERNNKVEKITPSTPVLVTGFESTPQAGDSFVVMESEREVREIALKRMQIKREQDYRQHSLITLDEIANQAGKGKLKELALIVKGDVDGSVEALADSLMKLSNQEVTINVIHKGVGAISESDVILATASRAIIVGFHVRPYSNARKLAEKEKVDIRLYNIIYDAINEVKSAIEGMLDPVLSEKLVATVEIRDTFKVPKLGTVAGCYVTDGKITRNNKIRLFRDSIVIYEGDLDSLKRFKDDVKEVDAGYECGLNIKNFNDIKIGDIIESYEIISEKQKLK